MKLLTKLNLYFIFVIFVLSGCNSSRVTLQLVAVQHTGANTIVFEDPCKSLYRNDGLEVVAPQNFKLNPYEAIEIAHNRLGYSCTNKFAAQIFADSQNYHIVRLGVTSDAIVINANTGLIVSEGFMAKRQSQN